MITELDQRLQRLNRNLPPGTKVRYWPGARKGPGFLGAIEAWRGDAFDAAPMGTIAGNPYGVWPTSVEALSSLEALQAMAFVELAMALRVPTPKRKPKRPARRRPKKK